MVRSRLQIALFLFFYRNFQSPAYLILPNVPTPAPPPTPKPPDSRVDFCFKTSLCLENEHKGCFFCELVWRTIKYFLR